MLARISRMLGIVALLSTVLGACSQPQPAPLAKAPSIGNPQAMAAAQAAMGVESADTANHPGKAIYDRVCAACHNAGSIRQSCVPSPGTAGREPGSAFGAGEAPERQWGVGRQI